MPVLKLIKGLQYRSFPVGEGDEGWGLLNRITECTSATSARAGTDGQLTRPEKS